MPFIFLDKIFIRIICDSFRLSRKRDLTLWNVQVDHTHTHTLKILTGSTNIIFRLFFQILLSKKYDRITKLFKAIVTIVLLQKKKKNDHGHWLTEILN